MKADIRAHLNRAPNADWCRITNKAEAPAAEVYIYDEIGFFGTSAGDFQSQLAELQGKPINLYLNSPGGSVFDGLAILNQLRRHDQPVNVYVDGLAASAASFIAMAGTTVTMGRNAQLMIHDAMGLCMGNSKDMAEMVEMLDRTSDNIADIYAQRAGGTAAEWRARMSAETWFSAQEAVDAGLADVVAAKDGENPEATNRFDLSIFNFAGRSQAPAPNPLPVNAHGMSAQEPPAEPEDNTQPTEGEIVTNDSLKSALMDRLGVTAPANEVTDEMLLLAAVDALGDKPLEQPTNKPPEGTELVDSAGLAELRELARQGAEAKNMLDAQRRAGIVDKAIADGKITPAQREGYLEQMNKAESVTTALIDMLTPTFNTVELGHEGGVESTDDPEAYPASWKTN